jgi:hypothetical protein
MRTGSRMGRDFSRHSQHPRKKIMFIPRLFVIDADVFRRIAQVLQQKNVTDGRGTCD